MGTHKNQDHIRLFHPPPKERNFSHIHHQEATVIFIVRDIQATEDQDICTVKIEFEGIFHDFFADRKRVHLTQTDTDINVINVDKALSTLLHSRITSAAEFRRFFGLIAAFFNNDSFELPASFAASE